MSDSHRISSPGSLELLSSLSRDRTAPWGESVMSCAHFCDGTSRALSPCNQEGQREVERGLCLSLQMRAMSNEGILLNQVSSQPCLTSIGLPLGAELISCSGDFMLFGPKTAALLGKLWRKLLFVQDLLLCQLGALKGQDPPLSPGRWERGGAGLLTGNSAEAPQKCCI